MKIKLLIFEDNEALSKSLVLLFTLNDNFTFLGCFDKCTDAENIVSLMHPDLILMDIDMPGRSGIDAVSIIKKINPEIKILMHTVFEDSKNLYAAIKNGANGYILKKVGPEKLIEACKDAIEGGAPITPSVASLILQDIKFTKLESNIYKLTNKETEVLEALVEGMSYKMIADYLKMSIDTVRSHIKKIYEKLHVNSMSEAVAKAIKNKIV